MEVFHNGHWGKVCNNNWGVKEASIVCKELGCGTPKKSQEVFSFGDTTLTGFISRCPANVNIFSNCTLEDHVGRCDGASVACSGKTQKIMLSCENEPFLKNAKTTFSLFVPQAKCFYVLIYFRGQIYPQVTCNIILTCDPYICYFSEKDRED